MWSAKEKKNRLDMIGNPMCEVYCLFSACEWFFNINVIFKHLTYREKNKVIELDHNVMGKYLKYSAAWCYWLNQICFMLLCSRPCLIPPNVWNLRAFEPVVSGPLHMLTHTWMFLSSIPPDSLPRLLKTFVQLCF